MIDYKIFREYDIRGHFPESIDETTAYSIGRAYARTQKVKKIAVGRDRRPASTRVTAAFIRGVRNEGVAVNDLEICSTPMLFYAVGAKNLDGGAMVTASHNPRGYAGLKLTTKSGVSLGLRTGLKKIVAEVKKLEKQSANEKNKKKIGGYKKISILSDYLKMIDLWVKLSRLKGDLKKKKIKVIIDARHGAGDVLADYIFSRLPVTVKKINFGQSRNPDFENGLDPTKEINQAEVIALVKKQKADLGIIFDGDADRCVLVDATGQTILPYYLNCLTTQILLARRSKAKLVIDARLPVGIGEVIRQAGGRPVVARAGTANIMQKMSKGNLIFGCENSGHYFFNLSYSQKRNFVYGDVFIPILLVLEYLLEKNISLDESIADFKKRYVVPAETNFTVEDFAHLKAVVKKHFRGYKTSELDGISVFGQGWFINLRPSKTEPLARLNIEANDLATVERLKAEIAKLLD